MSLHVNVLPEGVLSATVTFHLDSDATASCISRVFYIAKNQGRYVTPSGLHVFDMYPEGLSWNLLEEGIRVQSGSPDKH